MIFNHRILCGHARNACQSVLSGQDDTSSAEFDKHRFARREGVSNAWLTQFDRVDGHLNFAVNNAGLE